MYIVHIVIYIKTKIVQTNEYKLYNSISPETDGISAYELSNPISGVRPNNSTLERNSNTWSYFLCHKSHNSCMFFRFVLPFFLRLILVLLNLRFSSFFLSQP